MPFSVIINLKNFPGMRHGPSSDPSPSGPTPTVLVKAHKRLYSEAPLLIVMTTGPLALDGWAVTLGK